jgi:anti-sigma factor RsiW
LSDSQHISEDDLEAYYMDRIPEPELAKLEEHLLWCDGCLDRVEASDRYIDAIRAGARRGGFDVEVLAEEYRPKR